jgi:TolB-like protein/Tfp pilus assembly protein PilF
MFTDMVGYTALTQSDETLAMEVLERHNRLLRPYFPRFHGREVKAIGDSFLVEFDSALDAIRCAVEIQSYLHDYNVSSKEEWRIKLRIGIHLGDVIHQENDVFGDAVNIASRIEPIAEPEGVCVSEQVYDQVRNKFELPLVSIGAKELKNISVPFGVFKVEMSWEKEKGGSVPQLNLKRIAVLPFVSLSPDPSDEYFADGLTEELIDRLCQVRDLAVIARTSVMNYKKKEKNASQIGGELSAGALVEGSVRKAGNRIRVTAQLINANTEEHLWSSRYDRDLEDIFAVQTDIAEQVAGSLKVQLLPREKKAIEKRPTTSSEAYVLYLKGRYYWNERSPESMRIGIGYFEKAVREDPSFALAYIGLADSYTVLVDQGVMKPTETAQKVKGWVEKALELDPSLAEAHASLGAILMWPFWDWSRVELEFKRAIELNPAYPSARQWYGMYLYFLRRYEDSLEEFRKALKLDPFSGPINLNYAFGLTFTGKPSEGIEHLAEYLAQNPGFALGHLWLGQLYLGISEFDKATVEMKKALEIIPGSPYFLAFLGHLYGVMGRKDEGVRILLKLKEASSTSYVSPAFMAIVELALGKSEDASRHLDEAYDERSDFLLYYSVMPGFGDVRTDEKYIQILKKIGLRD